MLSHDLVEGVDEALEPVVAHECQLAIPERSLPIERMSPMRRGADFEGLVEARGLARGTEKREKRVGDGEEEEQAVTAVGSADVRRAETEAEADILGVAEGLFDGEPAAVEL